MTPGWRAAGVTGLVSLGALMGALDAAAVQLALPALGRAFGAGLSSVSWVSLAYLLTFVAFMPVFSRLGETFGRKWFYLSGFALFGAGTLMCSFASSFEMLVACRLVQGVGGAMIGANSLPILVDAAGPGRSGRALGLFAAMQALGMSGGPALGGIVLDTFGWPWIFRLTLPFGLAAVVLGALVMPDRSGSARAVPFDWRGAVLVGPALGLVVIALNHAGDSVRSLGATGVFLAVAALMLVLLVRAERTQAQPLVDLGLFGSRAFRAGAGAVILGYALLYALLLLGSFALQHGDGDSLTEAGLRLAVLPVAIGLTAPVAGRLSDRVGPRPPALAGMAICLVALAGVALRPGEPTAALALCGVGMGLFLAPTNHGTLRAAPAAASGQAASMLNLLRAIGTSFGVAAATAALGWRLRVVSGSDASWSTLPPADMLAAVGQCMALLAAFAVMAALALLVGRTGRGPAAPQEAEPPTVNPPMSSEG